MSVEKRPQDKSKRPAAAKGKNTDAYSLILSYKGPSLKEHMKSLEKDAEDLQIASKNKQKDYTRCKQKLLKIEEESTATQNNFANVRMEFNVILKCLQIPKPRDLSPFFANHLQLMIDFVQSQSEGFAGLIAGGTALLEAIVTPEQRYLNINSNIVDLRVKKEMLLKEFNKYHDEIQNIEKFQREVNQKFSSASYLDHLPLKVRSETLDLYKKRLGNQRKLFRTHYLKNLELVGKSVGSGIKI